MPCWKLICCHCTRNLFFSNQPLILGNNRPYQIEIEIHEFTSSSTLKNRNYLFPTKLICRDHTGRKTNSSNNRSKPLSILLRELGWRLAEVLERALIFYKSSAILQPLKKSTSAAWFSLTIFMFFVKKEGEYNIVIHNGVGSHESGTGI